MWTRILASYTGAPFADSERDGTRSSLSIHHRNLVRVSLGARRYQTPRSPNHQRENAKPSARTARCIHKTPSTDTIAPIPPRQEARVNREHPSESVVAFNAKQKPPAFR